MRSRYFWQDTLVTPLGTVVVYYDNGMLCPTVYLRGGRRLYPASVAAKRFVGHSGEDQREWEMGLIRNAIGSALSPTAGGKVVDPAFEKAHPTLFAFMTVEEEDGKKRTPSSLVLFAEGGEFKACLTEKDANLKLWRSAETFQKLLGALEKALASGEADWRRGFDSGANAKPSRRKK